MSELAASLLAMLKRLEWSFDPYLDGRELCPICNAGDYPPFERGRPPHTDVCDLGKLIHRAESV